MYVYENNVLILDIMFSIATKRIDQISNSSIDKLEGLGGLLQALKDTQL